MRRPRRRRRQVALHMGLGHVDINVSTAGQSHFRGAGRVSTALAALQRSGSRQQLRAMAHSSNWLTGLIEFTNQFQNLFVQAQILRRTAARYHQRVIVAGLDLVEIDNGEGVASLDLLTRGNGGLEALRGVQSPGVGAFLCFCR